MLFLSYHSIIRADNGTTFVVKDTDRFASNVIPEYFKHSNFSSFVRQLNFYGFRKIKSDPLRIKDAEVSEESRYWKFRHDKFKQGREDLLAEIKKSNHSEVETLKIEIKHLKDQLTDMQSDMDSLKGLVAEVLRNQTQEPSMSKKRKLDTLPSPVPSKIPLSLLPDPAPVVSQPAFLEPMDFGHEGRTQSTESAASDETLTTQDEHMISQLLSEDFDVKVIENDTPDVHVSALPSLHPLPHVDRGTSTNSVTTQDEQMLLQILAQDLDDKAPDFAMSALTGGDVDQNSVNKFRTAISVLPCEMQKLFVDRIVAAIANPDTFKKQAEAVTALASAAATEAQQKLIAAGHEPNDPQAVAMAASVLEAYLARYAGANNSSTSSFATTGSVAPLPPFGPF
jgi:HSF-type DNA-binding